MKVRITFITENDTPVSVLGENPEVKIKEAWNWFLSLHTATNSDKAFVENVEIVPDMEAMDS